MERHLAQARILLDTSRYKDAEVALRQALVAEPTHAKSHALLAYALYHQDRYPDALREAQEAIGLAPTDSFNYYVLALTHFEMEQYHGATSAIREAIRIDPETPGYHATLGHIYARKKAWKKALAAAETGLRADPEHVPCINLRAMVLVNLGRKDEAGQALESALARDPENARTHANQGWALLHSGKHQRALEHFREALRLDPMSDWARRGIVEALKAHNLIYRSMLRYFLWMSRLTTEEQWGVVVFISGTRRALRVISRAFPPLYIVVIPLSLLFTTFAVLTWVARPLFALLLRFDRFGRLALPQEEIRASNWVGACLLTSALGLATAIPTAVGSLAWGWPLFAPAPLVLALAALMMIVPVAGVFRCRPGKRRVVLVVYAVLLALVGMGASLLALLGAFWPWGFGGAVVLAGIFILGWTVYTWVANLLILIG